MSDELEPCATCGLPLEWLCFCGVPIHVPSKYPDGPHHDYYLAPKEGT